MTQSVSVNEVDLSNISEMEGKFLTFLIDKELYGVPIADGVQIVGIQEMTSLSEFPHYAKGSIGLLLSMENINTVINKKMEALG